MGAKHQALRTAKLVASIVLRQKLPTYFHGQLIWLSKSCWSSVYSRYEPYMADAIKAHLPRGGTFWDVGANIGLISLFASKIAGPDGHVLSLNHHPMFWRYCAGIPKAKRTSKFCSTASARHP
jgi:hypothetical protein